MDPTVDHILKKYGIGPQDQKNYKDSFQTTQETHLSPKYALEKIKNLEASKNKEISYLKDMLNNSSTSNQMKIEEISFELKQLEEKNKNLVNEFNKKVEETIQLEEKLDISDKKLENASNEIKVLKEQYEDILRQLSEAREEIERGLKSQEKYAGLEEKAVDLESKLVATKSKLEKYKKLVELKISNKSSSDSSP